MQLLGLGHCRDTIIGDGGLMLRGISGGERKRLTTAEMVVGPQRVLLMDEISTGLDSATLHSVIMFFTSVSAVSCCFDGLVVMCGLVLHLAPCGAHTTVCYC